MNCLDPEFLQRHIKHTMSFYHPRAIDPSGGFHHYFRDNGEVYNASHRHLVSSARFVVIYARFARHHCSATAASEYLRWVRHGLAYLENAHFQTRHQGYAWTLNGSEVEDQTHHCYGLAFVLLAYAEAALAGIEEARDGIARVHTMLLKRFWEPQWQRFADEADCDWQVSDYRGQNANMHACEALISAWDATGESHYLEQALNIAQGLLKANRDNPHGWIWEHYDRQWRRDLDYNRDDPRHLFRPWGYQVGHQTEWAKLLVLLAERSDDARLIEAAERLFLSAVEAGWDTEHGGLVYGLDLDGRVCDDDKYFWVQAESFAAAAMLGVHTGKAVYWRWYRRLWDYSWQHMIDHRYGAWYRILSADNRRYSDEKSPAGKVDYHTMGACQDVIRALNSR